VPSFKTPLNAGFFFAWIMQQKNPANAGFS